MRIDRRWSVTTRHVAPRPRGHEPWRNTAWRKSSLFRSADCSVKNGEPGCFERPRRAWREMSRVRCVTAGLAPGSRPSAGKVRRAALRAGWAWLAPTTVSHFSRVLFGGLPERHWEPRPRWGRGLEGDRYPGFWLAPQKKALVRGARGLLIIFNAVAFCTWRFSNDDFYLLKWNIEAAVWASGECSR